MKVIIAGSRDYRLTKEDYARLDALNQEIHITEVVSGLARGVDMCGLMWAESLGIPVARFPADWKKYPKAAGPIRNAEMAKYVGSAGAVVLFPGGKGTQNMYEQALKHGLTIFDWRKPVGEA